MNEVPDSSEQAVQSATHPAEPAATLASGGADQPRVVAQSTYPDGSEEIAVSSVGYRSTWSRINEVETQEWIGRPPQREDDALDVCKTLRQRLNRDGGHWGDSYRLRRPPMPMPSRMTAQAEFCEFKSPGLSKTPGTDSPQMATSEPPLMSTAW
jgi:hypothetical protein